MQLSFTVEEANAAAKEAAAAAADGEEAAEDSSKSKISGKKCLKNVYDILKHLRSWFDASYKAVGTCLIMWCVPTSS